MSEGKRRGNPRKQIFFLSLKFISSIGKNFPERYEVVYFFQGKNWKIRKTRSPPFFFGFGIKRKEDLAVRKLTL